jgi:hypothetical protein
MKIYVASRVLHADLWKSLREPGAHIIATWIDEAGEGETADFVELWQRIRGEIASCDVLVFYAAGVQDFPFKGALVEVGMALALGKPVYAALEDVMLDGRTMRPVGSWLLDRNVRRFDTLEDAMREAAVGAVTLFQCKLDKSKCDHDWNNEGCNPTHCLKCGQSFTAYAFMEAP